MSRNQDFKHPRLKPPKKDSKTTPGSLRHGIAQEDAKWGNIVCELESQHEETEDVEIRWGT